MRASIPATVLLVDGSPTHRQSVSDTLRQAGYCVREASTGREALQVVSADVDILVLNLELPDMSGIVVARQIQPNVALGTIPVLHFSTDPITEHERTQVIESAANQYLAFPVSREVLIATLESMIQSRRAKSQAGSDIGVEAPAPLGFTFPLHFPRTIYHGSAGAPESERRMLPHGTETILLAEDEPGVRALARYILTSCGYHVHEARDGEEAVQLAAEHGRGLDLFLTDVVMPRMGGREAAEKIVQRHPLIRILFMSGYTDDAVMRHGILTHEVAFLQKPFTPAALAVKVREVLDEPTE